MKKLPSVAERFIRYAQIDTQSDPNSLEKPTTPKQKNLSQLLVQELKEMGIQQAEMDEQGYVYATIPATTSAPIPVIAFCAHVDTAPDCNGTGVKPLVHFEYDGKPIVLPDDPTQIISPIEYPYLSQKLGDDIITASGTTLLGADDKSGVAVIMELARQLVNDVTVKHGTLKLLFTPDEEVGRGAEGVNIKKLGADFGYTLDGGALGDLEDETFSADGVVITIHGIIVHPGTAKGKLVNALKIAAALIESLPKKRLSPETTEKREGFVHPVHMEGLAEKATISFIIRDFDTKKLLDHEDELRQIANKVLARYPGATMNFEVVEQYRNMKEVLDQYPQVVSNAKLAIKRAHLPIQTEAIRGGTDGSRLSFMGLPCPNIFTGMQNLHSKHEWISIQDMEKSVSVLLNLVQIWAENASEA